MQKNIRVDVMKDLYKEIPKATTRDLASIIDFLKRAREVRVGKPKNAEKPEKSMWKSNLIKPICLFGGKVVQEQPCKWLSNTETKTIIRFL